MKYPNATVTLNNGLTFHCRDLLNLDSIDRSKISVHNYYTTSVYTSVVEHFKYFKPLVIHVANVELPINKEPYISYRDNVLNGNDYIPSKLAKSANLNLFRSNILKELMVKGSIPAFNNH